jgi:hypothetical protein
MAPKAEIRDFVLVGRKISKVFADIGMRTVSQKFAYLRLVQNVLCNLGGCGKTDFIGCQKRPLAIDFVLIERLKCPSKLGSRVRHVV